MDLPTFRRVLRLLLDRYRPKNWAAGLDPFELPGVGPKTADVWLNLVAGRDTMPMDTHIARLVRRWHLSAAKDYDGINEDLRRYVPEAERQAGHLALIYFGREICQARRPQCEACPVYEDCDAGENRRRGTSRRNIHLARRG